MDETVQQWLDQYLRAWESNEPDHIGALFTADATYAGGPLDPEPWLGLDNIIGGWISHRDEPGTWTFEGGTIVAANDIGIIQGTTRYDDGRVYANLWVITFAPDGRARSFVEWFMKPGPVRVDHGVTVDNTSEQAPYEHVATPYEHNIPELEVDETIAPRPEEEIADLVRAEPDVEDHSRSAEETSISLQP